MITTDLTVLESTKYDVCVVGSGPVGSSLAVDLKRKGFSVLVLESGLATPDEKIQTLSDAFIASPHTHHPMALAVSRSLGGTSRLWGGRCNFLDEIDFQKREHIPNSGWPIRFEELSSYLGRAAELLGCDDGSFRIDNWAGVSDPEIDLDNVERWVNETRTPRQLRELSSSNRITVLLNATVVGINIEPGAPVISGLRIAREGCKANFRGATYYILALGGIETARLLLNVQTEHPRLFFGTSGHLGRNYMGHLSGSIAFIRFFQPDSARLFRYIKGVRSYARHRFTIASSTQLEQRLPNVAFWPDNENFSDARHGSGILSSIGLILNSPVFGSRLVSDAIRQSQIERFSGAWPHLRNVVKDGRGTVQGAVEILRQRFSHGRRLPRLFVINPSGLYPLHFHAEQVPSAANGVHLSNECDWLGVRRAIIDLKFSPDEMTRIKEAHRVLDRSLRRMRVGELIYRDAGESSDPLEQLQPDGLHQIGLTRMAARPSNGVVDVNCKIFEFQNAFIAGSSVFPTAGQANPTLPAVGLGARLSDHIEKCNSRVIVAR